MENRPTWRVQMDLTNEAELSSIHVIVFVSKLSRNEREERYGLLVELEDDQTGRRVGVASLILYHSAATDFFDFYIEKRRLLLV